MRIIMLLFVAVILQFTSVAKTNSDFIYLNSEQLSSLGLNLTEKGLFYKNLNAAWTKDDGRYPGLMFYCGKDNYLTSSHFDETEIQDLHYKARSLKKMKMTQNDFYPVLIGSTSGQMSLDNLTLSNDQKLVPIAIDLGKHTRSRDDIIVVWFKPTESLKQALPKNIDINKYLKTRSDIVRK